MNQERIIDMGVVVSDLERSLDFYTRVIGMEQAREFHINPELAGELGLTPGISFDVKVMQLPGEGPATILKLIAFTDIKGTPGDSIGDQTGIRYMTLRFVNLSPVLERLKNEGIQTEGNSPVLMKSGSYLAVVKDPDGIFLELAGPLSWGNTQ